MNSKLISITALALGLFSCGGQAAISEHKTKTAKFSKTNSLVVPDEQGVIKLALLLDTSGSMGGLIEQAKSQLWKIVNQLSLARKNGQPAKLEIALYHYGNSSLIAKEDYVKMLVPLTQEMDLISEELFNLTTNGGEEYCGSVIQTSLKELEWENNQGFNVIFIAGNESFNQGEVKYNKACEKARDQQVLVNTVFCGPKGRGMNLYWKEGAELTEGNYMYIEMENTTTYVHTPYDDSIAKMNTDLNGTYMSYGSKGFLSLSNQSTQDLNSMSYGAANNTERIISKSSGNYYNKSWDLVDAAKEDKFEISKIDKSTLTDVYKDLSEEELNSAISANSLKRDSINTLIRDFSVKRESYINELNGGNEDKTSLDYVMLQTVREQAERKGFVFED
jgi:hypothetical protein